MATCSNLFPMMLAATAFMRGNAFGPGSGCRAVASYPCLPGLDAVGIGFDAVKGTSFGVGRPVIDFNYTEAGNFWVDPFGNNSKYSYADQMIVTQKTTQATGHSVYRSVHDYISQQQNSANIHASVGMFFKASAETKWAKGAMSDSLHIVAVSECELGVYSITLSPTMFLKANAQLLQYFDSLPDTYDEVEYMTFLQTYGTHYVSAATFGGKATMKTVISHDYYSTQSDSSIIANVEVGWGKFGGGGGGGHSSNTTDQKWSDSSTRTTFTSGGDPAIKSFNSPDEWTKWARSVETGSPVITAVSLVPLWQLLPTGPKQTNFIKAVRTYASNETFPQADLTGFQMSWCECYSESTVDASIESCPTAGYKKQCQKDGFFITETEQIMGDGGKTIEWCPGASYDPMTKTTCCRPCFTASD